MWLYSLMKFAIKGVLAALAVLDRAIGVIERLIIGGTMLAKLCSKVLYAT